ncbi:MAG TPA: hypothetical protein PKC79_11045 [Solidesulfovibrio magneticus]|nr:hypothetical protein [Solidesulfovibrio magneticus]
MVLRGLLSCIVVLTLFVSAASAGSFDCVKPPYGKPFASMNEEGAFQKVKEEGGIAYYNYTGPCRIGVYERLTPIIAYGVVDNKLYSRVMQTENDDIDIIRQVTTKLAGTPKTTEEGDWTVMRWNFPEKQIKMKLKYNNKTKATKSALYYEPLRPGQNKVNPEDLDD